MPRSVEESCAVGKHSAGLLSSWDLTVTSSAHWPSPTRFDRLPQLLFPTFVSSVSNVCS